MINKIIIVSDAIETDDRQYWRTAGALTSLHSEHKTLLDVVCAAPSWKEALLQARDGDSISIIIRQGYYISPQYHTLNTLNICFHGVIHSRNVPRVLELSVDNINTRKVDPPYSKVDSLSDYPLAIITSSLCASAILAGTGFECYRANYKLMCKLELENNPCEPVSE